MTKKEKTWADRVSAIITQVGSIELAAVKLSVSYHTVVYWKKGTGEPSQLAQKAIVSLEEELQNA